MSKKSRGFQPERSAPADTGVGDAAATDSTGEAPSATTPRAGRASRRSSRRSERGTARVASGGGLDRYRGLIVGVIALVAVGVVGVFLFQGASAAPYVCESLLTPPPFASGGQVTEDPLAPVDDSAAAQGTGFGTQDLGRGHLATGTTVSYAFCPPTSGQHWSDGSRSPLRRDVYGPGDAVSPGNWVHNLEHGYVVFAYEGEPDAAVLSEIRRAVEEAPPGELAEACGIPNKVIAVRFDEMAEPFAALAWDRALLMPEWDTEAAMAFASEWQDPPQAPEQVC